MIQQLTGARHARRFAIKAILIALAFAAAIVLTPTRMHAAGAFAIGKCAAYGYAFDFAEPRKAVRSAQARCKGACNVMPMTRACAAFAVDMVNPCGAHGYAVAKRISAAQNTALRYCYRYGGKDCVIRAWACDARG